MTDDAGGGGMHGKVARVATRARRGGACGGGVHGDVVRAVTRARRGGACSKQGPRQGGKSSGREARREARAVGKGRDGREGHRGQRREAREVVRAQLQGKWYSVIGSERIGFFMEDATHLYLYFFQP
jgi:hypothetical protein